MILANENAIESGGYVINNSLRFQSANVNYATRTMTTPTNNLKWTWTAWVKRGIQGTNPTIIEAGVAASRTGIVFNTDNSISLFHLISNVIQWNTQTTAVYRDPSAWYHVAIAFDSTQATASNRVLIYINGVVQVVSNSYPALNGTTYMNSAIGHYTGVTVASITSTYALDGYLAENYFIDGQALTPSSFGNTDATSGQWVAKKYTGTYGTNGFYLPFSNGTSTTTLGADSSGNSNNWTLTNFTRSAGVSDCFMFDVPSGNGSGSGTQPSSNYCVMNPLSNTNGVASNANLTTTVTGAASFPSNVRATVGISSGKYYWEQIITGGTATASCCLGIIDISYAQNINLETSSANQVFYFATGNKLVGSTLSAYGSSYTTNDVIGSALDLDASTITFYKNNTSQGSISLPASTTYSPVHWHDSSANTSIVASNFGQRSFAYTPPTGFKALCTANLPTATIKQGNKYMDATTYTGTGVTRNVANAAGFQPDFVWVKSRSGVAHHILVDSVRGATGSVMNTLFSSQTSVEQTTNTATDLTYGLIQSIDSNGFTVATGSSQSGNTNANGSPYVGWQWKAGNGTSSNTNGTITSTTSVGATQGFSIVTWTGNGTTGATIGHGLGIAPKMIIAKTRGIVQNWVVYRPEIGNSNVLLLNSSSAAFADGAWNSTTPTSSVFTVNNGQGVNQASATYVAYCFAEIAGFSKFGSYTGNGSADGTFVYTGFRPKYVMIKSSTAVDDWRIYDASRPGYNVIGGTLLADTAGAETTAAEIDFTSNGFKLRITTTPNAAQTYIYAAFASNPFAQSNAV